LPVTPQFKVYDVLMSQLFKLPVAKVGQEVTLNTTDITSSDSAAQLLEKAKL